MASGHDGLDFGLRALASTYEGMFFSTRTLIPSGAYAVAYGVSGDGVHLTSEGAEMVGHYLMQWLGDF
jgi:hypothetical protein